jgi:hypothetical protein
MWRVASLLQIPTQPVATAVKGSLKSTSRQDPSVLHLQLGAYFMIFVDL